MSNSLQKMCCVSINLCMSAVYVIVFVFFLNASLHFGLEIL